MPSKIFQPLLFDSFKFRLPETTYVDHYGKKSKRKEFKTVCRAFSGIVSQRDRMSVLNQRSRPFSSTGFVKSLEKDKKKNFYTIKTDVKLKLIFDKASKITLSTNLCFFEG